MNRASIIGHLTRDPELRATQSGLSVCTFSVAVNRKFSKEKEVDFFNCVAWRSLADNVSQYLSKGSKCFVSGQLQNRSYEAQDGTKRYVTEIVADEVEFLDTKPKEERAEQPRFGDDIADDDLPF
jgi:single-strand DNA-binding protein